MKALAAKRKSVHYYTRFGRYIGSLYEPHSENYSVQNEQMKALENQAFKLAIAKKIVSNKVRLQSRLLEAHDEEQIVLDSEYANFASYIKKIENSKTIEEILGYEGRAAKSYFYNISLFIDSPFRFRGRSKRPPLDPFNSMISFGYDILYNYIRGAIVKSGLNMGFGYLHHTRNRHAALASDLMEEWRPILIDDTVLQLIKRKEITTDDFKKRKNQAVYIKNHAKKIYDL